MWTNRELQGDDELISFLTNCCMEAYSVKQLSLSLHILNKKSTILRIVNAPLSNVSSKVNVKIKSNIKYQC